MAEAYLPYQGCGPQAKSIAKADVTLDFTSITYDGSDHAPAVQSVSLNGKELRADQDYVYTAVRYKDAGNYNVQVMGINEYGGVKTVPWHITKAKGSIRVEPAQVTIQGVAGTTATVNIIYEGDGDITVSESQYVTSNILSY